MQLIEKYQACLLDRRGTYISRSFFGRTINFWMHGENRRYKMTMFRVFNLCWITLYEEDCRYNYGALLCKHITCQVHDRLKILFDKRRQLDIDEKRESKKVNINNILSS
jgi:hypothetical protein